MQNVNILNVLEQFWPKAFLDITGDLSVSVEIELEGQSIALAIAHSDI